MDKIQSFEVIDQSKQNCGLLSLGFTRVVFDPKKWKIEINKKNLDWRKKKPFFVYKEYGSFGLKTGKEKNRRKK
ncbi:hypothetical protein [Methanolapillus ohkumae]|uniref:hypothetical protein n=1 Tax=Methanolapillus ohkumae TaxID=3028298 RepID=UPI0030B89529